MRPLPAGIPYVEARRIRYLTLICDTLLSRGESDIESFIELLLLKTKKLNANLPSHTRTTGILRSSTVAKGYIEFCKWLGWIDFDGPILLPNGYTAYISAISGENTFRLSPEEKIGIFTNIVDKESVRIIINELRASNRISELRTTRTSEHFIESIFDFLVDLEILLPSQKSYGFFRLTEAGEAAVKASQRSADSLGIIQAYGTKLLKKKLRIAKRIPEKPLMRLLVRSIKKLSPSTRSQWDPNLHSALPVLLYMRLLAIKEERILLSFDNLIENVKVLSTRRGFQFKWEELSYRGYVRLEGER